MSFGWVPSASCWSLCVVGIALAGQLGIAQAPDTPPFQVASVKPNRSGAGGGLMRVTMEPGGLLLMINVSLREMMRAAYQIRDEQLLAPDWFRTQRFDLVAKASTSLPPLPPPPTFAGPEHPGLLMLRELLRDRFQLEMHRGTKSLQKYALVLV